MTLPSAYNSLPATSKAQLIFITDKFTSDKIKARQNSDKVSFFSGLGRRRKRQNDGTMTNNFMTQDDDMSNVGSKRSLSTSLIDSILNEKVAAMKVSLAPKFRGFYVEVRPFRDLWITSPVVFIVELPDRFPKIAPLVRCVRIDEAIRTDMRLMAPVNCSTMDRRGSIPNPPKPENNGENKQTSRVDADGTVRANLFQNQYMGWLEMYSLEVIVYTLRLLFTKSELELTPSNRQFIRENPYPLSLESDVHESQGPRQTMEDRVYLENLRVFYKPKHILLRSKTWEIQSNTAKKMNTDNDHFYYNRLRNSHMEGKRLLKKKRQPRNDLPGNVSSPAQVGDPANNNKPIFERADSMHEEVWTDKTLNQGCCVPFYLNSFGRRVSLHVAFDGHGGSNAAQYASTIFASLFFSEIEKNISVGIDRALHTAIINTDERLVQKALREKEFFGYAVDTSGTTLCAVAIDLNQGILYCANLGDSRAVLCRKGGIAVDLSRDHKAALPEEIARIVHNGGFVSYGRVLSMLAISRALGDVELKVPNKLISASPNIVRIELCTTDDFFIIACDGLFDVLSSQDAVDFVRHKLSTEESIKQICVDLVNHSLGPLSSVDNVSVIVGKFNCLHSRIVEIEGQCHRLSNSSDLLSEQCNGPVYKKEHRTTFKTLRYLKACVLSATVRLLGLRSKNINHHHERI